MLEKQTGQTDRWTLITMDTASKTSCLVNGADH